MPRVADKLEINNIQYRLQYHNFLKDIYLYPQNPHLEIQLTSLKISRNEYRNQ